MPSFMDIKKNEMNQPEKVRGIECPRRSIKVKWKKNYYIKQ